jgi:hypothetical protein
MSLKENKMDGSNRYFIKEKDLVTRNVAGETIIVPIKNNVGDLDSIYTLNEVGSMIWQLIDGNNSINRIIEEICKAYDVGPEEAEKDTLKFLNTLKISGLIQLNIEEGGKRI